MALGYFGAERALTRQELSATLPASQIFIMANTRSASKRARQTTQRALRNRSVLTRLRGMQKGVSAAGAKPEAKDVRAMISAIDKAAKRGIIHKNAAKRRKARLNKSLGGATAAPSA